MLSIIYPIVGILMWHSVYLLMVEYGKNKPPWWIHCYFLIAILFIPSSPVFVIMDLGKAFSIDPDFMVYPLVAIPLLIFVVMINASSKVYQK